ncbi:MAG: radical SAM family heme chaperone HemW [Desulfobacteraceae bacterium]|nr:radical SAM family heme chaperone HemW [Desulfobacteraceae bacterium]
MSKEQYPGLYIHVPFCRSKCFYCDFYSVASSASVPEWLDCVRKEALLYKESFPRFDSLYLGGGTPSSLSTRDLADLLEHIRTHFRFSPGAEMTMEANPDSICEDKLKAVGELGINRISLGVQSLDDRDLEYLGRNHRRSAALAAIETVRSLGLALSADLIYGLETQSLPGWKKTVDGILAYRPEHISCYQLSFEEATPLWKMKAQGRVRPIDEKLERAFFIWTSRHLESRGYLHYEISNFARSPETVCRHNLKYWKHVPYLGLGPSAHSFGTPRRWWNVRSVTKYCRLILEGKAPVEGSEVLSEEQLGLESLSLGLRTSEGVDLAAAGTSTESRSALENLKKSGLIRVEGDKIRPTLKGFLVADSLPLMLQP